MRGGICTSGATRFRGRATTLLAANTVFPTVTLFPYWGTPSPHGFSKLQPFSVGAGPSGKRRNTPHQKEKGNQAEALRSRGELSASFSFKLDSVSVKQHVNQNAEAEAFRSRMRHSRRPSSACQKNKRAIKPKLCVAEMSFQCPFKLVWKWYFNGSAEAPFWSIKSGLWLLEGHMLFRLVTPA